MATKKTTKVIRGKKLSSKKLKPVKPLSLGGTYPLNPQPLPPDKIF